MKIGGVDPSTLPNKIPLVLPRGDTQIVFWAQGIPDFDEFNKLCPEPVPPMKVTPRGPEPDVQAGGYVASMAEYNKRFSAYLVVRSLAPSEIEWDTVDMDQPGSWDNWREDLKNSGFIQAELNQIQALVYEANALDTNKLETARANFLAGQRGQQK